MRSYCTYIPISHKILYMHYWIYVNTYDFILEGYSMIHHMSIVESFFLSFLFCFLFFVFFFFFFFLSSLFFFLVFLLVLFYVFWSAFFFFFFFFFFRASPAAYGGSQVGVKSELQLLAYTTATACEIWAMSSTYTTGHGNARSWTPWARPGLNPHPHGS